MSGLPTFDEMRHQAERELGDVLDGMRSDWREGHGPNRDQADAWRDAVRLIVAAKAQLTEVARRAR